MSSIIMLVTGYTEAMYQNALAMINTQTQALSVRTGDKEYEIADVVGIHKGAAGDLSRCHWSYWA
jgi:hypothetical protein